MKHQTPNSQPQVKHIWVLLKTGVLYNGRLRFGFPSNTNQERGSPYLRQTYIFESLQAPPSRLSPSRFSRTLLGGGVILLEVEVHRAHGASLRGRLLRVLESPAASQKGWSSWAGRLGELLVDHGAHGTHQPPGPVQRNMGTSRTAPVRFHVCGCGWETRTRQKDEGRWRLDWMQH